MNSCRTGISELDLSNTPNLKYLVCDNTNISELDFTELDDLQYIYCSGTDISELNIDNLHKLTRIHISDTKITKLRLINKPHLEIMSCANNDIKQLFIDVRISSITLYVYPNLIPDDEKEKLREYFQSNDVTTVLDKSDLTIPARDRGERQEAIRRGILLS